MQRWKPIRGEGPQAALRQNLLQPVSGPRGQGSSVLLLRAEGYMGGLLEVGRGPFQTAFLWTESTFDPSHAEFWKTVAWPGSSIH